MIRALGFPLHYFLMVFSVCWAIMLWLAPASDTELLTYSVYSLLGIVGAIFANSTGAGGGVIFIPAFSSLGFSEIQAIATSFAIQCFGMTAGAITWWQLYRDQKTDLRLWQGFKRIIAITTVFSILGLLVVQQYAIDAPGSLHQSFSQFSLVLGCFIIASVFLIKPSRERSRLTLFDGIVLVVIGLVGGAITAWLSVGVGELVALYLILRRFDTTMAVAAAVIISALTVWIAIWQHTLQAFNVYWQVVIFAGPGAVLGGIIAKTLVSYLSATRLKLFFAFWLVVIGFAGIQT